MEDKHGGGFSIIPPFEKGDVHPDVPSVEGDEAKEQADRYRRYFLGDAPILEKWHHAKNEPLKKQIEALERAGNLASYMTGRARVALGQLAAQLAQSDDQTRSKWRQDAMLARDLVDNLSANKNAIVGKPNDTTEQIEIAKHPLLANAVIDFAARTSSSLRARGKPVKCMAPESELDLALEIEKAMNYQCIGEDAYWEKGTDQILTLCAMEGVAWRRRYYDPLEDRFVTSVHSGLDVIVPDYISRLEDTPRISFNYVESALRVRMKERRGYYHEVSWGQIEDSFDPYKDVELLEQCTWLPLIHNSPIEVPVVMTIEKRSQEIIRLATLFDPSDVLYKDENVAAEHGDARFKMLMGYHDYHFITNLTGGYHSQGYGVLLSGTNSAMNSVIEEIVRSAKRYSDEGGFVSAQLGLNEDPATERAKWTTVDAAVTNLRDFFFEPSSRPPSNTLYSVLGLMQEAGRQLSSTVNFAEMSASVSPTQIAAMTAQGERVAADIFSRLTRDMTREFRGLLAFNRAFRKNPTVYLFQGEAGHIDPNIFLHPVEVVASADPALGSEAKRYNMLQMLGEIGNRPGINQQELTTIMVGLLDLPEEMVKRLLRPDQTPNPEIELKQQELQIKQMDVQSKAQERRAKVVLLQGQLQKMMADIENASRGHGFKELDLALKKAKQEMDVLLKMAEIDLGHKQLEKQGEVSAAKTNGRLSD